MRKKFQFNSTGLNLQENRCEMSHMGLGSVLAENSLFSYDQVILERERLCNLLDAKKEALAQCRYDCWKQRELRVEIAEIRRQLEWI